MKQSLNEREREREREKRKRKKEIEYMRYSVLEWN